MLSRTAGLSADAKDACRTLVERTAVGQTPHSLHRGWFKKFMESIYLPREFYASLPTRQNFEVQVGLEAPGDIHIAGSMYI